MTQHADQEDATLTRLKFLEFVVRKVASKDAREGRSRSPALESRDAYFFFGADFLVAFFTVFLAFGAEALAARFAFAMMTRLVSVRRYQKSTWETVRCSNGTVCGQVLPSRQLQNAFFILTQNDRSPLALIYLCSLYISDAHLHSSNAS